MAAPGTTSSSDTKSDGANSLDTALARLNAALDKLEKSTDAAIESRNKEINTDEQIQRMTEDRAKLARDLDDAQAKIIALKDVNSEVSRRLVGAMEMVRGVVDKQA